MKYRYDGTNVARFSGYDAPVMVWPVEFEAAEAWDYERWLRGRSVEVENASPSFVIPAPTRLPQTNGSQRSRMEEYPLHHLNLLRSLGAVLPSMPRIDGNTALAPAPPCL